MYSVTVLFDLAVLLFSTVSTQMRILLYKWAHKMRLTEEHKATAEVVCMAEHSKHLVEYGSPVQLGGQIVEKRADLERTADEHAQLT